jgi:hypothetical protein
MARAAPVAHRAIGFWRVAARRVCGTKTDWFCAIARDARRASIVSASYQMDSSIPDSAIAPPARPVLLDGQTWHHLRVS